MSQRKRTFDPETMGYGKHEYREIDPELVNVEMLSEGLRGEQEYLGDVREYNSAYNSKHPENDVSVDDLSRIGGVFETEAEGVEGQWEVVELAYTEAGVIYACVVEKPDGGGEVLLSAVTLGVQVDADNLFPQVVTKMIKRGKVGKDQRVRLTKHS